MRYGQGRGSQELLRTAIKKITSLFLFELTNTTFLPAIIAAMSATSVNMSSLCVDTMREGPGGSWRRISSNDSQPKRRTVWSDDLEDFLPYRPVYPHTPTPFSSRLKREVVCPSWNWDGTIARYRLFNLTIEDTRSLYRAVPSTQGTSSYRRLYPWPRGLSTTRNHDPPSWEPSNLRLDCTNWKNHLLPIFIPNYGFPETYSLSLCRMMDTQ